MSEVSAVQVSLNNISNPALWFIMCERIVSAGDSETSFGEEQGSRKPSELLRNRKEVLKRHAESLNVDDKLKMELFLQRLPSSVQTILTGVSDLTLNKAADIADRILEVSPSPIESFAVSNKNEQSLESKLFREIEKLNERIDRLSISRGHFPYLRNKNSPERSIWNKRDFSIY
ncbi:retrovirus-related Pol polyprotein from transposon opus [Trichonephila clavipes]|nr:retrovirus-related Pol polyprotein from transposon opus [Trichonephila clavipes]